jgi:hypothetical protein
MDGLRQSGEADMKRICKQITQRIAFGETDKRIPMDAVLYVFNSKKLLWKWGKGDKNHPFLTYCPLCENSH